MRPISDVISQPWTVTVQSVAPGDFERVIPFDNEVDLVAFLSIPMVIYCRIVNGPRAEEIVRSVQPGRG